MADVPASGASLRLIVAARPTVAGVVECLTEAESVGRSGGDAHVLLTEDGFDVLSGPWFDRLAAARVAISLCTRSARARRVKPEGVPASARWSSLTTFLATAPPGARLWTAFP